MNSINSINSINSKNSNDNDAWAEYNRYDKEKYNAFQPNEPTTIKLLETQNPGFHSLDRKVNDTYSTGVENNEIDPSVIFDSREGIIRVFETDPDEKGVIKRYELSCQNSPKSLGQETREKVINIGILQELKNIYVDGEHVDENVSFTVSPNDIDVPVETEGLYTDREGDQNILITPELRTRLLHFLGTMIRAEDVAQNPPVNQDSQADRKPTVNESLREKILSFFR